MELTQTMVVSFTCLIILSSQLVTAVPVPEEATKNVDEPVIIPEEATEIEGVTSAPGFDVFINPGFSVTSAQEEPMDGCSGDDCICPEGFVGVQPFCQPVTPTELPPEVEEPMDGCSGEDCLCPEGFTGIQPFCTPVTPTDDGIPEETPTPMPCPEGTTGVQPFCQPIVVETTPVAETTPDFGDCPSADPCFLSKPQDLKVVVGDDAEFSCDVGNLGFHYVAWMKADELLTMGNMKYTTNRRITLAESGVKLVVKKVMITDADTYLCQINTTPPKKQYYKLEILVPPSAGILPALERIEVNEGEELTLTCETGGNPEPEVVWTKTGALLPSGENIFAGAELVFPGLGRDDGGIYECTASNGVRSPATAKTEVHVNFAPTVTVGQSLTKSKEGGSAELTCMVEADPQSRIDWQKIQDGEVLKEIESEGVTYEIRETIVGRMTQSTLHIAEMEESDFGRYKCTAENDLGVDDEVLDVSGLPGPVTITSGADCIIDTECAIAFKVSSLNAIVEYHVRVREYNDTADEFGNLTVISVVPSEGQDGEEFFEETIIEGLNPSTQYQVDVYAHTKFGAGAASPAHYLTTNEEGATYPPPPTTTTPEPPTTVPVTTPTEGATVPPVTTTAPQATDEPSVTKINGAVSNSQVTTLTLLVMSVIALISAM